MLPEQVKVKIGQISKSDQLFKKSAVASLNKNLKLMFMEIITILEDGTCVRDYIHVSDIAKIHTAPKD